MIKYHHSIFSAAIVAISSLLPDQAFAEAKGSIHPDLRGIWAIGSCAGTSEGLLIIRGTMVMTVEEGDATAQRLVTDQASDENGWIAGRFEDDATPLFLRRVPGRPDVLELTGPTADPDDASVATRPGPTPDPVIWEMLQFE